MSNLRLTNKLTDSSFSSKLAIKLKRKSPMRSFLRALTLTSIVCAVSTSAMAAVAAPGPEIGDGVVGTAVVTLVLLAFVMLGRLKRSRQSKEC
jgi:hypothetical protein